jgi:adenylate kinase family enzyme
VLDDVQMFEELCVLGVEDEAEPYVVGPFRTCCPVTFARTGLLQRGSARFVAEYRNSIFLFANAAYRDDFVHSPARFLLAPPTASVRIFLAGPPSTRLSALATRLAARAGVELIDGSVFRQMIVPPPQPPPGSVPVLTDEVPSAPPLHPAMAACIEALGTSRQFVVSCFPADPVHVEAIQHAAVTALLVYVEAPGGESDTEAEHRLRGSIEHAPAGLALKLPAGTEAEALVALDEQLVDDKLNAALKMPAAEAMHQLEESLLTKQGLGVTGRYCPVALQTNFVLFPGANDASATYADFNYHFSTEEARAMFMANPARFVTPGVLPEVPPPRILVLGAANAGKTIQCRKLVRRTRLFHMSFHERLKEMSILLGSEHGDTIKTHLADPTESPLPADVALAVVQKLWLEEPYRSTGFVLEGFPRNEEEARSLFEAGLYPDCVVDLTISSSAAIKRSLPGKLTDFRKTREAVLALRKAEEDAKATRLKDHRAAWEAAQARRRDEREAKRQQMGDDYESDGEGEEEYVEPEDEEDAGSEEALETEEAATERFKEEITTGHELVIEGIKALTDLLREEYRVPHITIDAGMRDVAVWDTLERSLRKFLSNRGNLLLQPYVMTSKKALALMQRGTRRLSVFGEWCPVRLAAGSPVLYSPRGRWVLVPVPVPLTVPVPVHVPVTVPVPVHVDGEGMLAFVVLRLGGWVSKVLGLTVALFPMSRLSRRQQVPRVPVQHGLLPLQQRGAARVSLQPA